MSATPLDVHTPRITVVGDTLLDVDWSGDVRRVCPDAPAPVLDHRDERARPGGAGLAALLAAEDGALVTLVTALGDDADGDIVRSLLDAAGVTVLDLCLGGRTPVKLRVRAAGQSLVRVDRGCVPVAPPGAWDDAATAAVRGADAVLVSDYGRGMAASSALTALPEAVTAPVVWDPHARGPVPPPGLDLLVPNRDEGLLLADGPDGDGGPVSGPGPHGWPDTDGSAADGRLASRLARRFGCAVAMTVGERGAVVAAPGVEPVVVPVDLVAGDACGAGDRFAATAVVARAAGVPVVESAATAAAAAARHVEAGARATWSLRRPPARDVGRPAPEPPGRSPTGVAPLSTLATALGRSTVATVPDAPGLARAVRATGGTVVVAGGCFDVLHAGHVQLLGAARRLGDCLVVCLNGDRSVRRLKGRRRPVNPVDDRIAVLQALGSVDAVHVFDEDDPRAALEVLRPHVFVKGADHVDGHLPERQVLAAWGGEVVFVPVVPGRSTTRVLEIAAGTTAS